MLYFARWKVIAILVTAILVCGFSVPNFFPEQVVKGWPAWAQRRLVLGLDLQGGSQILLEVDLNDVRKQRLDTLRDDVGLTERAGQQAIGEDVNDFRYEITDNLTDGDRTVVETKGAKVKQYLYSVKIK